MPVHCKAMSQKHHLETMFTINEDEVFNNAKDSHLEKIAIAPKFKRCQ